MPKAKGNQVRARARKKVPEAVDVQGLTDRQRAFIEHYFVCWNASEAARRAGYRNRANTAGAQIMSNDVVRLAIEKRLSELAMDADEVLARLADHARGTMDDFIGENGNISLLQARKRGKMHLLKSYSSTDRGERIEIHDPQAALVQIGRHLGLFIDKAATGEEVYREHMEKWVNTLRANREQSKPSDGTS